MIDRESADDLLQQGREYEHEGKLDKAIIAYEQVLQIPGGSKARNEARQRMDQIRKQILRGTIEVQKDVVVHCMTAIERFADMRRRTVQEVLREIARKGRVDMTLNNTPDRFRISTLGIELTALGMAAYMFTGLRLLGHTEDIGIDLRAEYEMARRFATPRTGTARSATIH